MADTVLWDYDAAPAGVGLDVWDTLDDYNNNTGVFPGENPWLDDSFVCGFGSISTEAERTWEHVTTTPETSASEAVFRDLISQLLWTRGDNPATQTWSDAISYCESLDHGGFSDWRLPTQKELMSAYNHGIFDLHFATDPDPDLGDLTASYWSATSSSVNTADAWLINLSTGAGAADAKVGTFSVLCVQ